MRDVVTGFYVNVLNKLISTGAISKSDSVLIVCGGPLDERVMTQVGFKDFTVTNLDAGIANHRQDAENLTYENNSFDVAIVHAGLHHCHSPHRALLEMYRVARKCAVAFESRDSLMMRAAVRLGLTMDYELSAISADGKSGGGADTGVPNFFYDLRIPIQRFTRAGNHAFRIVGLVIEPMSKLFAKLWPKQCNEFAFAISKAGGIQPWIKQSPPAA